MDSRTHRRDRAATIAHRRSLARPRMVENTIKAGRHVRILDLVVRRTILRRDRPWVITRDLVTDVRTMCGAAVMGGGYIKFFSVTCAA